MIVSQDLVNRLLDLARWQSFAAPTVTKMVQVETSEEMAILPDTLNGPMLQITLKNTEGVAVHIQRLNLPAIDDQIGRLIRMRDRIAAMKDENYPG